MKIAFVYIGHIRENNIKCFNNFKKYVLNSVDNYDIFIHTWDTISTTNKTPVTYSDLEIYKPKKYIIEKQTKDMIKNYDFALDYNFVRIGNYKSHLRILR